MYAIEYGNADDNTRNDKFCQLGPARADCSIQLHVHEFANICHFLHSYRRSYYMIKSIVLCSAINQCLMTS